MKIPNPVHQSFEIVETADGSHTVYSPEFDEHYHSHHGALAESRHVFLGAGMKRRLEAEKSDEMRVFEMGFGTGLNALLACQFAEREGVSVHYWAVEKFPLPVELCHRLNYAELPGMEGTRKAYDSLINAAWNEEIRVNELFSLTKINGDFFETELPKSHFDLVFFDAFGSGAQPAMWEEEALGRCYEMLKPGGLWVTYAAKGSARRSMEAMGFSVERIAGAPGKREMMRATKIEK